jgi:hypothetical protein
MGRVAVLLLGAGALYGLAPELVAVWSQTPRLASVSWLWFLAMALCEAGSLVAVWALARVALPRLSWFTAGTAQLASNAVSRTVPGGAPVGGALYYRMLAGAGIDTAAAGTMLAATSILSTGTLFAVPGLAVLASLVGVSIPPGLASVAWAGAGLFLLLFLAGVVAIFTDRPLAGAVRSVARGARRLPGGRGRTDPEVAVRRALHARDVVARDLGGRWPAALASSAANWGLDFLALAAAVAAVGARPRLSLLLLAYALAAVLAMLPITPGGLGFVEAGLTATLTVAGMSAADALLATLAYRIVSFWLPIPAGLVAYLLYRRRFGGKAERQRRGRARADAGRRR